MLGDFGGSTFAHFGVTSTFSRSGEQFVVRTDGPDVDGEMHDYPVAWVFGTTPLQQYLIDVGGGRLQALGIAWDCRSKKLRGQRWFHLYPHERLPPSDELHWTGIQQKLELPVRRVPLDEPAPRLRRRARSLRDDVVRARRVVRGLPRAGVAARRLGAGRTRLPGVRCATGCSCCA